MTFQFQLMYRVLLGIHMLNTHLWFVLFDIVLLFTQGWEDLLLEIVQCAIRWRWEEIEGNGFNRSDSLQSLCKRWLLLFTIFQFLTSARNDIDGNDCIKFVVLFFPLCSGQARVCNTGGWCCFVDGSLLFLFLVYLIIFIIKITLTPLLRWHQNPCTIHIMIVFS